MRNWIAGKRGDCVVRKGQSLVEFAIALLVTLLLVFGAVEIGRAVFAYNTVANAAREGVRYAIVHGADARSDAQLGPTLNDSRMQNLVRRWCMGLQTNLVTTTCVWTNATGAVQNAPGAAVTLRVNYTFVPLAFGRNSQFPSNYFFTLQLRSTSSGIILN
ncbi:MAG: pilus assembly protein [Verrucomicrobia bacterium]|nr:pilus assembly protein [Verrucomicrobiota bacterium]